MIIKHHNITFKKLVYFCVTSGIGGLLFIGIQYPLIEILDINYIVGTIIASIIAMLLKFILSGVFVFNDKNNKDSQE